MATSIVDRDSRDRLATYILELGACEAFHQRFVENVFSLCSDEPALDEIGRQIAIDTMDIDDELPSREHRRHLRRTVLFLRTSLPYEYGEYPRMDSASCLLTMSTGGLGMFCWYLANYPRIRAVHKRWKAGDDSVWPFYRRSDYEVEYAKSCPFARFKAA